jgi:hypothetical protein
MVKFEWYLNIKKANRKVRFFVYGFVLIEKLISAWPAATKVVGFQPTPGQGGLLVLVLLAST